MSDHDSDSPVFDRGCDWIMDSALVLALVFSAGALIVSGWYVCWLLVGAAK